MNARTSRIRPILMGLGAITVASLVLAGDVNPPPGPGGDCGPSLGDILLALGGPSAGEAHNLRAFAQPASGAFEVVSSTDGILQRVIAGSAPGQSVGTFVHVRDANGLIAQFAIPGNNPSQSYEVGAVYTAPLEVAVSGPTSNTAVTVIVREND